MSANSSATLGLPSYPADDDSEPRWIAACSTPIGRGFTMRQRMWRSILALSIGAAISATAAAQTPAAQAPAASAAPVVVVSTSGCNGCGQPASSCDSCGKAGKHHGGGVFRIGAGCASTAGCSSCKQERTFLFGGCHQFFNAGNDCGRGFGHGGGGVVYGPRAISPPCTYFTYLNR
jgi:hypothetical protein